MDNYLFYYLLLGAWDCNKEMLYRVVDKKAGTDVNMLAKLLLFHKKKFRD